ncbi:hypothetical protein A2881_00820 [Candidatus Peribacteria bacterium RIFCSPHIGHO2_01_FULL_55_13]|nr:MAG: hypothetical protein A2881_00820 [Candidatus Peribacteria bacterium RIFCSPHIGHO2_01_FULL_55_13]
MPRPSHRHSVILPLLALSILGTGVAANSSGGMQAVSAPFLSHGQTLIVHPSGVQGIVLEGARMDETESIPELLEGSALIVSHAPIELRVGAFRVQSIGGGYHITKSGNGITVAALTTPVLLTKGALRAVVPVGMQWKITGESLPLWKEGAQAWMDARSVRPLPKRFWDEQRELLQTILVKNTLPEARVQIPLKPEAGVAELPEAGNRRAAEWSQSVLGVLRSRVESDDVITVQELLLRPDLAEAFSTPRARSVAATLLFSDDRSSAMQQQLLPILLSQSDLWLLLSLHPAVSTVAWTLPAPAHDGETAALRLFLFPYADRSDAAGHASAWNRWQEELLASVQASADRASIGNELIIRLGALAQSREEGGYPARARFIAATIFTLSKNIPSVSPEARETLSVLKRLDRVEGRVLADSAPSSATKALEPVDAPEALFDALFVESQAREMLRSAGAAFSLETRIIPLNAHSALVEKIVFAGNGRDRTIDFTLDIGRSEVSRIREKGEEFAYALPIGAFVEWIRR